MATTKAQGILHFDTDYDLTTQGCLPAKGTIEALSDRLFYILVNNNVKRQQNVEKHKVLGCLTDDTDKSITAGLQPSDDGFSPKSFTSTVGTEKALSIKMAVDQKDKAMADFISVRNEYANNRDEFVNMQDPFARM